MRSVKQHHAAAFKAQSSSRQPYALAFRAIAVAVLLFVCHAADVGAETETETKAGAEAGASAISRGMIRAPLKFAEDVDVPRIREVLAVQRRVQTMRTRRGDELDIGLEAVPHRGVIRVPEPKPGNDQPRKVVHAVFDDLPVPGNYDLRIELDDGSIIHGWDANVPASDYVGDPEIEPAQARELLRRQSDDEFTAFFDHVVVLDVQGNVQNASLLVAQLRQRPFVGGGYRDGEWVWRVDRWQWEDPWEHNWTPYRERPFYALVRQRVFADQFESLRWRFARQIGGVNLTVDKPSVSLEAVILPAPGEGVRAVGPDGTPIEPIVIKGNDAFSPDFVRE